MVQCVDQRWSPWERPWSGGPILKSLALASKLSIGHEVFALAPGPFFFSMSKAWADKYTRYCTSIYFKNINLQYFTILLDHNYLKNFVKKYRLPKQHSLHLEIYTKKSGNPLSVSVCPGALTDEINPFRSNFFFIVKTSKQQLLFMSKRIIFMKFSSKLRKMGFGKEIYLVHTCPIRHF